jgi:hypothetical protein
MYLQWSLAANLVAGTNTFRVAWWVIPCTNINWTTQPTAHRPLTAGSDQWLWRTFGHDRMLMWTSWNWFTAAMCSWVRTPLEARNFSHSDQPKRPPSLLYNGYGTPYQVTKRSGRALPTQSLLAPRSSAGSLVPLSPQSSVMGCNGKALTFATLSNYIYYCSNTGRPK